MSQRRLRTGRQNRSWLNPTRGFRNFVPPLPNPLLRKRIPEEREAALPEVSTYPNLNLLSPTLSSATSAEERVNSSALRRLQILVAVAGTAAVRGCGRVRVYRIGTAGCAIPGKIPLRVLHWGILFAIFLYIPSLTDL